MIKEEKDSNTGIQRGFAHEYDKVVSVAPEGSKREEFILNGITGVITYLKT